MGLTASKEAPVSTPGVRLLTMLALVLALAPSSPEAGGGGADLDELGAGGEPTIAKNRA